MLSFFYKLSITLSGFFIFPASIICQLPEKPFGDTIDLHHTLKGEVYYIPYGTNKLPNFKNLKPVKEIYTEELNIPPRKFNLGFPGIEERYEWFAIKYSGNFYLDSTTNFFFRLASDDGSKLYIDDTLIINNDGQHSPIIKTGNKKLSEGYHTIKVEYFQGPADYICLVLQVFKKDKTWEPFRVEKYSSVQVTETEDKIKIVMDNSILFGFDSSELMPEAILALNEIYKIIQNSNSNNIIVSGHTDNSGSKEYNYKLSIERALSVKNALVGLGIQADRMNVVGLGEDQPVASNDTEENKALNRRVEIDIMKPSAK